MDDALGRLRDAVLALQERDALDSTRELLDAGAAPERILERGLTEAMSEIGRRWQQGLMYLPQVMVAARIFARCGKLVEPHLPAGRTDPRHPAVVLATVKGDVHDLGKSIVGAMIRAAGYPVVDLGKDVAPQQVVDAVREHQAGVVALSAMLTSTMPGQRAVLTALAQSGLRQRVHVMVGGAPVTERWAQQIGADAYASNAAGAVGLLQRFIEPQEPTR